MWQDKRSLEKELLDLGEYTSKEYHHCLKLLGRINQLLGGFNSTKRAFQQLNPSSILEIGCGGGYLCKRLHQWFPDAQITGIDLCPEAIVHAQRLFSEENITFQEQIDYPNGHFDVVTTMLVCHHMTDEELITFLKESYRISQQAVIINDLHRHLLAYLGFSFIAPFLFPNRLIWHDGRLSIKRSFRKHEWITLLKKAGFSENQYQLKWNWPFRWTLTLNKV